MASLNLFKPLAIVIGTGGRWDLYPDHPPSLAIIHEA